MRPFSICRVAVVLSAFASVLAQNGSAYEIAWFTVDGGGGTSTGGNYVVHGTLGQPDTGAMTGGRFSVTGGFWSGLSDAGDGSPRLRIKFVAGNVVLSWPASAVGFQLQAAATPLGPDWTAVSQTPVVVSNENQVTLAPALAGRMFRLFKP